VLCDSLSGGRISTLSLVAGRKGRAGAFDDLFVLDLPLRLDATPHFEIVAVEERNGTPMAISFASESLHIDSMIDAGSQAVRAVPLRLLLRDPRQLQSISAIIIRCMPCTPPRTLAAIGGRIVKILQNVLSVEQVQVQLFPAAIFPEFLGFCDSAPFTLHAFSA
jgi:hypothetical protein